MNFFSNRYFRHNFLKIRLGVKKNSFFRILSFVEWHCNACRISAVFHMNDLKKRFAFAFNFFWRAVKGWQRVNKNSSSKPWYWIILTAHSSSVSNTTPVRFYKTPLLRLLSSPSLVTFIQFENRRITFSNAFGLNSTLQISFFYIVVQLAIRLLF